MNRCYIAYIGQEKGWWIGYVQGVRGVNCQERTQSKLINSMKAVLVDMLDNEQESIEQATIDGFKKVLIRTEDLYSISRPHNYGLWASPDGTKMTSIPNHGDEEEIVPSIIEWICRDLEIDIPMADK